MIILDTNILSELMRPAPDPVLTAWFAGQDDQDAHTTVITLAELAYGLERLPDGRRRESLLLSYAEVFETFDDKVLDFDRGAAVHYGALVAACERVGRPMGTLDAQIASIALARRSPLATRNVKHFRETGVTIINPWAGPGF